MRSCPYPVCCNRLLVDSCEKNISHGGDDEQEIQYDMPIQHKHYNAKRIENGVIACKLENTMIPQQTIEKSLLHKLSTNKNDHDAVRQRCKATRHPLRVSTETSPW